MEYILKVLAVWDKVFTWLIGVLLASLQLAFNDGLVDTYAIAFTIITWAILADFLLGFFNALINSNRTLQSKKMGQTITKLTAVYFVFFTLAILALLTYQNDSFNLMYYSFHWALLLTTTLVVSREVISLIETADDMGLAGAKRIKQVINNIPNLFIKK